MSVGSFIVLIKNIYHVLMCVVVALPIVITMGMDDPKGTQVVINENADNPYINDYLDPDVSAHRSGAGLAPQNTLMAFEAMLKHNDEFGVDTFEFDVQLTADGELIVLHDLTYDATSNAVEYFGHEDVYASDLTLEEAKVLNLGENFEIDGEYPYRGLRGDDIPDNLKVATCREVIELIESNTLGRDFRYIIEIKSTGTQGFEAADKLYEIITQTGIKDRTIWASSKLFVPDYMEHTYPDMPRSADVFEVLQFYFYARMDWDLNDVSPSYVALQIPYGQSAAGGIINTGTKTVINYAHKYNISAQYWTINAEDEAEYLIENGADCIMSDYPDMVFEKIKEANK